eukprot:TRINITY_DN11848_c1_g3_i1.p1 TRINITY_DN11848_c1_g3~~TRINITY_DN11848_c1_g3_i1.p1  ORF type:complete len:1399 (+),score=113.98 TRINITY_DN11848_c1_g3_i1:60-4256(+)
MSMITRVCAPLLIIVLCEAWRDDDLEGLAWNSGALHVHRPHGRQVHGDDRLARNVHSVPLDSSSPSAAVEIGSRVRKQSKKTGRRKRENRKKQIGNEQFKDPTNDTRNTSNASGTGAVQRENRSLLEPMSDLAERPEHMAELREYLEKVDNAIHWTTFQHRMYEFGWIFISMAVFAILIAIVKRAQQQEEFGEDIDVEDEDEQEASHVNAVFQFCHDVVCKPGKARYFFNFVQISLGITNFAVFAIATEYHFQTHFEVDVKFGSGKEIKNILFYSVWIQTASTFVLMCLVIIRMLGSYAHSKLKQYGCAAPLALVVLDVYTLVEVLVVGASLVSVIAMVRAGRIKYDTVEINWLWLSLLRTFEMVSQNEHMSTAMAAMLDMRAEAPLLRIMAWFAFLLWIIFSGLYYVANHDNRASEWEAVAYHDMLWQRFESIPSSMFFVLINLSCEYPMADVHKTACQRIVVMLTALFGVPLFAIPTSVIGKGVQERSHEHQTRKQAAKQQMANEASGEPEMEPDELLSLGDEEFPEPAWKVYGIAILSFSSVIVYFLWTASYRGNPMMIYKLPVTVPDMAFAIVDGVVGSIFLIHMFMEISDHRSKGGNKSNYFCSSCFPIDFLSSVPGILHCGFFLSGAVTGKPVDFIRGACVFRVLKFERYVNAFFAMREIVKENSGLLIVTGFICCHCLMWFSALLYLTEHENPDADVRQYYGSIVRATWSELINLHGEWCWCDYTGPGKAIGVLIAILVTGIVMVPIAVMTDGFASKISETHQSSSISLKPWQYVCQPPEDSWRFNIYMVFYEHLFRLRTSFQFKFVRMFFMGMTTASLGATICCTMPIYNPKDPRFDPIDPEWTAYYYLDGVCVSVFAVEFVARCVATNGVHAISCVGLAEATSIFCVGISLDNSRRRRYFFPEYDGSDSWKLFVLMGRSLRIFHWENYAHSVHLFCNVARAHMKSLLLSFYALVSLWFIFATLLHLNERDWYSKEQRGLLTFMNSMEFRIEGESSVNDESYDDHRSMRDRYDDILTALQYALVHLTGDYPLTNYRWSSMPFHVFFVIMGMVVLSSFAGIFTAAVNIYLTDEKGLHQQERISNNIFGSFAAVVKIQYLFRLRRREDRVGTYTHPFPFIRRLLKDTNPMGRTFQAVCMMALFVNIANTFASTTNFVRSGISHVFPYVELATSSIFCLEYVFKLLATLPPFAKVFTPMRVLDFVCLVPTIAYWSGASDHSEFWRTKSNWDRVIECMMVFRCLRILDLPVIRQDVRRTSKVVLSVLSSLFEPVTLAFFVWFLGGCAFLHLENYYQGPTQDLMRSLPDALYWNSIFVTGEWATVDFSPGAGSRLCILYCLFFILIFALPIGVIADAIHESMHELALEKAEMRKVMKEPCEDVAVVEEHDDDAVS